MTEKTKKTKTKATHIISKFNFEVEGSAVALVSASQGGAANSFKTLVIKSADKYSPEFIQKAQKVQVVMEFDDFLQKFFNMWKEDAKILTSILGFGDEGMDSESEVDDLGVYNDDYFYEWFDEKLAEEGASYRSPTEEDKLAWLEYRKQGITLVKSLAETDNKLEMLAALSEKDYWSVLNEQKFFEKALNNLQSGGQPKQPVVTKTTKTTKATKAVHNKENNMSGDNPVMIEKAQYDAIQKALDEQKEQLEKANKALADFEAKEKLAIEKARKADILAAVEVEETAEKLYKAIGELAPEAFADVIEVVKSLSTKVEKSAYFTEQGTKAEGEKVAKSALRAAIENKHTKQ